ncbi:MAG: hypothetical protein IJK18_02830 [Clostridia bacterium]|nr:hypothetical protein [Clostridia bacterium]
MFIKNKLKMKGEKIMINRINKKIIIILLFTMLFTIVFPKEANAATYNTRTSLYNAGRNAVGKTVRIYRSGTDANDAFEQDHPSSQVYCIQHNVTTIKKHYYDYTVKNYIKISGNVATNSAGKSVTSNKNLALAYLIDQENLRKGYAGSGDDEIRNLSIKHYMTAGGWMSSVGSALGISSSDINYFNISSANRSSGRKQKVTDFVNRAIDYSKKYATSQPRTTIEAEMWICVKSNAKQNLLLVKSSNSIETPNGQLTINKIDKDTKKVLKAGFKIQTPSGKWLSGSNGSYNYENTFASATEYSSPITLKKLKFGTYKIYEVKAPSGYILEDQPGYDAKNKWVYFGTAVVNANTAKVKKTFTNSKTRGNLTITKIDKKTKKALKAGFKIQTPSGKWLSGKNGSYNYNNTFVGAEVYTSPITLKKLKFGIYKVYEVIPPKGYILEDQPGYDKTNKWVYFGTATINANIVKVTKTYTNYKTETGSLTINKVDKDTGVSLSAGFKIQTSSGQWLSGTNGSYNYNNSLEGAQTYASPITLSGLKFGTYKIYEVTPPKGYDLAEQEGYDKTNNWVPYGKATINANSPKVSRKITNEQKISIKGYVWIDTQATKDGAFNSLYDNTREAKVAGVTVKLIDKSSKNAIATTKTNASGEYLFENLISRSQLKDYYVEFNYNGVKVGMKDATGKDYQEDLNKYIPVAFNSENANDIKKEGSRAIMDNVAYEDTKLSGVATTYKGTDKETTYGLSGNLYNKLIEGDLLNNINLGIKRIPDTDYNIDENLASVKIVMKGYDYTYTYGGQGDRSRIAAPKVNFQKKGTISGYTADIYPSDIAYDIKNSTEELKVYVKYRIDITNTTTIGTGDAANNYNELYKEKALHISKLTDKFDTKRYKLSDSNWTEKDGIAIIKEEYLKDIKEAGIGSNKTGTKFIEFSVNHDAILDILNHPYGIIEEYPTKATAIGYHEYTRKDYSWQNNITKDQTHRTVDDTRDADAPYLIFKLGQERILSGKVFEDKVVTNDGQKLGNGVYDDKENIVKDVKVELLDILENISDITKLPVSNLYGAQGEGDNARTAISNKAVVVTGADGIYTFNGVVPGYYVIRFTYGDGTQKICDISGKEISTLSALDYKSTIVTNEAAKGALKGGTDAEWYKKLGNTNATVAVDNLDTRIGVNNGTLQNIMAGTAKVSITIENTITNTADIVVSENGAQAQLSNNKFEGLNLGVIEMPIQSAKIEKIITNIRLVNAQNNIGFEGNPETDSLQGVSDLDNVKNGGSTYVRAELHDDMISGATFELTYAIKVTNTSDVNYYNKEYYWYGESQENKEVTLVINELTDYLDKVLDFDKEKSDSKFNVSTDTAILQNEDISNKTIISLSNWNTKLYTEKNTTRKDNNCKTSDTVSLVANRLLSAQDDDMEYINDVQITTTNNGTDDRDNSEDKETFIKTIKTTKIDNQAQAKATITPPTGADRQTIIMYVVVGTLALAILSAGVVVIKKYVVK